MPTRILVTEDHSYIRDDVCGALKRNGFDVEGAPDGVDALRQLEVAVQEGWPFDCVLVDLEMPRMNGMELLNRLARYHPNVGAIVFTASTDDISVMSNALDLGAQYFILADLTPFEDTVAFIRAGVAQKRTERWKRQVMDTLNPTLLYSGVVEILRDCIQCRNIFVATADDNCSQLTICPETASTGIEPDLPLTDELISNLRQMPVVAVDGLWSRTGSGEPIPSPLWLAGIVAPAGEFLGVIGIQAEDDQELSAPIIRLLREMASTVGTVLGFRKRMDAEIQLLRSVNLEFAHWMNSPLQVWSYLVDAIKNDAKDTGLAQDPKFQAHIGDLRGAVEELKSVLTHMRRCEEEIPLIQDSVDLSELVGGVCRQFSELAHETRIEIRKTLADSVQIYGDRTRLEYLIRCLMQNSVDAIEGKRQATTEVSAAADAIEVELQLDDEGNQAILRVKDSGIGFRPELRSQVFLPMFTTKKDLASVHGVGLFSAKRIALAHHGDLLLERTQPNAGSTFIVKLPVLIPAVAR